MKQHYCLCQTKSKLIQNQAPYLISMHVKDLTQISKEKILESQGQEIMSIPLPTNEPTIGVLDTQFDKRVYLENG
ncbi:MAG: hypothetical protein ACLTAI_08050 [Thomasclavelia sp.]